MREFFHQLGYLIQRYPHCWKRPIITVKLAISHTKDIYKVARDIDITDLA